MATENVPTRTDRIVARVRRELEQCGNVSGEIWPQKREQVISEALTLVRAQANSLEQRAGLVLVTRQIMLITAHALGRMNYPSSGILLLDTFCTDIDTLVHEPATRRTEGN